MIKKIIFFMLSLTCTNNYSTYESNDYVDTVLNNMNQDFQKLKQMKKFKSKHHKKLNQELIKLLIWSHGYFAIGGFEKMKNTKNTSNLLKESLSEFVFNDENINIMKTNLIKKLPSIILSNDTIELIKNNKISKEEKRILINVVTILLVTMQDLKVKKLIQTPEEIIQHFEEILELLQK